MTETRKHGCAGRILVVDDSIANLQFLMNMLKEHGYIVHPASDGELALEFVRATLPDLILLDIRLPGMDGFEVCRRLKAEEKTRAVPVIFISVLEDERDKVRGFRAGAVDYISKPFQTEEVLVRIQTQLRLRELTERLEQKVTERTAELQHEMTERIRTEETLKESERQLRQALQFSEGVINAIPDLLFELDRHGRYLNVWTQKAELLAAPKEILLGRTVHDALSPEAASIVMDSLREAEENELSLGKVIRIDLPGGPKWFELSVSQKSGGAADDVSFIILSRDITERKQAEQRLALLEHALNNSREAAYLIDEHARFLYVNDEACRALGYSRYQLLGMGVADIDPEITEELWREVWPSFREMGLRSVETCHKTADGRNFQVEVTGSYFEYNGVGYNLALARDITERKRMEDALLGSEQNYRTLAESLPDNIVRYDRDCRATYYNGRLAESVAIERERFLGKTPIEAHPETEETAAMYESSIRRALADGAPDELELIVPHPDGEFRTHLVRIVSERNAEGVIIGALAIGRDITERKQVEMQLLQQERQYKDLSEEFQTLLDGIPDLIIHLNPDLTIIWANMAVTEYHGGDVKGLYCHRVFHKREVPCERCPVVRAFTGGKLEEEIIVGDDGTHWGIKAFPLKDDRGRVVSVIDYASDITEKIRLREETARTVHLAALGELAAGVAHEINNPNGVVLLNVDFLGNVFADIAPVLSDHARRDPDFAVAGVEYAEIREDLPHLFRETRDSARRIKRIVDDLKEFAQPITAEKEFFDLNAAAQTATRLAANVIKKSTDCFQTIYGEEMPKVMGSRQAIEQVVINLITNACQALPDRSRSISVTTRFDSARRMIVLEVCDQGNGILPENLPRITAPFFTTRRKSGGTGLGLAVSSRLLKEHGGSMHFASTPGAGTTVSVTLPPGKEGKE